MLLLVEKMNKTLEREDDMKMRNTATVGFACLFLLGACIVHAEQKGLGDDTGMARTDDQPSITRLSGEVTEVKVGPCEHTTGKAEIGFHLILQTEDGKKMNLHVGPADALKDVRDRISVGQTVGADVYRTPKMPADAYITKSLTLGEEVITIRDDNLRPVWAGQKSGKGKDRKRGKNRRAR